MGTTRQKQKPSASRRKAPSALEECPCHRRQSRCAASSASLRATAPFPRTCWSEPLIRWRTGDLTTEEPLSFKPTARRASKSDWAIADWRFSIFLRRAISPCRIRKPATGSSITAKSTTSARSELVCKAKAIGLMLDFFCCDTKYNISATHSKRSNQDDPLGKDLQ